jgi:UDP-glucuronate 4-epimerase
VHDNVDHPISLYAASKKANELMAHSYSHLYGIPCTGLRFFTVYGPWYRPDMALFVFADAIVRGNPVKLFNAGRMLRDFTYIDDVTKALVRLIDRAPQVGQPGPGLGGIQDPGSSIAPWRIYNVGNNKPQELLLVLDILERELGRKANKELLPMQPGDVPTTYADVDDLVRDVGFRPATPIEDGIQRFAAWYRSYHETNQAMAAS